MQYLCSIQDPVSAAAIGLIPVELDSMGPYEDHDYGKRDSRNKKAVAPHVLSVCKKYIPPYNKKLTVYLTSVDVPKIEPHSGHFVTGKSNKWQS